MRLLPRACHRPDEALTTPRRAARVRSQGQKPAAKKAPAGKGPKGIAKKAPAEKKKRELPPKKTLEELDAELTDYTAQRGADGAEVEAAPAEGA